MMTAARTDHTRYLLVLTACLSALPLCAQEEGPFTRLFDTGVASAQPLADEAMAKRAGWALVPEDKNDHPFSGDAVLLNDKLAVVLRKQGRGAEVYAKAASGLKHRASIGHVGLSPATTDSNGALKIVENSSSAVMVQATGKGRESAALSFRLTTGEAILEIRSSDGCESVGVLTRTRYVVVPDYFGDDMVFDASSDLGGRSYTTPNSPGQGGARVTRPSEMSGAPAPEGRVRGSVSLPAENFCLHLLDGGEAIVMSVWQSSEQDVWLAAANPGQPGDRCSSRIRCLKGKSIWLAFLESPGLWHAAAGPARDDWKPPFPAKWRCSFLRENGVADSWDLHHGPPPEFAGARHQGPLVVYPLDRSAATPLTVTCPTDVMRNTLGVGPCQYILACEGLAAQGDPTPNSVMNWVEKQFEQKKQRKAADDIKERLEVMSEHVVHARARIQQYAEFASQVRKRLLNRQGAEAFRPMVDDLDRLAAVGLGPGASPERARQLAGEVAALIGKDDALAACRRVGEQLRSLGVIQDGALAKCRMAVRRLRAQCLTLVASQGPEAGLAPEVQRLAEQMLQKK